MRQARALSAMILTGACAGLSACATAPAGPKAAAADAGPAGPLRVSYLGGDAILMGGDLVQVKVAARGPDAQAALQDYARCWVAGYAVENNAGFVRHVRTLTGKEGGIWRADAVYSVTSALPEGLRTIDAEVTVADCAERGIPVGETPAAGSKTGA